jgi:hypothetical protein
MDRLYFFKKIPRYKILQVYFMSETCPTYLCFLPL